MFYVLYQHDKYSLSRTVRSDTNILVVSLTWQHWSQTGPNPDCIVITVNVCIMVNSLKPIYMPPYLLLSHYCITGGAGNTPNWSSCFCWLYMSCAMTWPVNSGMNVNYLKILIVCTANLSVNSMPPSLTMSFCWLSSAIFFKTNSSTAAWGGWCVAPCHCCRVLLINNARNSKT